MSRRVTEAITQTIGSGFNPRSLDDEFGILLLLLLAAVGFGVVRGWDRKRVGGLMFAAGVIVVGRAATGLVFVPGFVPAFPLAAVGIGAGIGSRRQLDRVVTVIALVGLPLVYATDYLGSKDAQWGGRYVLCSSLLLGVVGFVALLERARPLAWVAIALCAAMTLNGFVYFRDRSNDLARGWSQLAAVHADVIVSETPALFRDMGAFYDDNEQWLTISNPSQIAMAATIAEHHNAHTLAVLVPEDEPVTDIPGWRRVGSYVLRIPYNGSTTVATYARVS
jgi:hypothetical protein